MRSKRAPYKLDQLGFVGRGRSKHRPRNDPSLYGGEYPFFQTGDVKGAELYLRNYSSTYNEKGLAQSKLWRPGTLCVTIAANIADTSILSVSGCFPDSVVGFVADPKKSNVFFVKYYLDTLKAAMQSISHGTTQDNLSLEKLLSFDFWVPSVEEQRKIASVLLAYDDLIENNARRVEILEEMARRLYEEWFVKFRFPGHEDAVFEKMTINNVADVVRGRSYRSAELVGEGRPFVNLKCVNRDGGYRRDGLKYYSGKYKAEQLVSSGDIIMAVTDMTQERRIVARVALVPDLGEQEGVISMDLVRIVPRDGIPPLYLYSFFRWSDFADNVKNHATGANVLHLHPDLVASYDIDLPPQEVCKLFAEKVRPAIELVDVLEKKNANLRAQRDLLLPKLISGEIDISEIPMPT
ncbi:TPA: restriction endonuclease subunit S [Pseudomonas putida]|uniref:Restriction endonuclease subunit S n=1 Tax=Pseudomonas juntendi TaxID=2666183 RepID=A0ABZ2JHB5_9PSED|nr:restriction endonuclease subunit S [Pseudomonas putida]ELS0925964.1 restriction endonuclease subunit S [Pseudomonas putida]HDS0940493.1 restriction endonuclease subunit S [Pseudomonas putida]HEJ1056467.1 restriction endonuclease subunit S [Pseudomonas putida]